MEKFCDAVLIALALFSIKVLVLGAEITFHNDDGSSLQWTVNSDRCYNVKGYYNNRAITIEVDSGCFTLFKNSNCTGEKRDASKGSHNLKSFGFSRTVSSVKLCESGVSQEGRREKREIIVARRNPLGIMQAASNQQELERDVAVSEHNKYRRMHGVPDVKGNKEMHEDAQKWVDELVRTNNFKATTMGKYGNNIGTSFQDHKVDAIRDVIKTWYDKGKSYNFTGLGFDADDKKTGSFTAIVWKATTDIGVGIAWSDPEKQWIINVFYLPPVMRGQYQENVLPPK